MLATILMSYLHNDCFKFFSDKLVISICQSFILILPQGQVSVLFCSGHFIGKENGWVITIKMNARQRMSDNQLSVWVADFPKEVLILLKFIRKLLKRLSRMLISSQKEGWNCIQQEGSLPHCDWDPFLKHIHNHQD